MDVKIIVFLQFYNKSKFSNGAEPFLEQNCSLFIVKFRKLGFNI